MIYVPTILYNGIRTICNVTTHPIPDAANGEIMYTALSAYNRVYIGTLSINFAKTFVKYLMIKDFVLNVYKMANTGTPQIRYVKTSVKLSVMMVNAFNVLKIINIGIH